jgi:hypothetical protein
VKNIAYIDDKATSVEKITVRPKKVASQVIYSKRLATRSEKWPISEVDIFADIANKPHWSHYTEFDMNEYFPDSELLKAKEASEYIGITPSTFRQHVRSKKIKPARTIVLGGYRIPLYDMKTLDALKESIRPNGKPGRGRPRKGE